MRYCAQYLSEPNVVSYIIFVQHISNEPPTERASVK
jgi:hypothetical protein